MVILRKILNHADKHQVASIPHGYLSSSSFSNKSEKRLSVRLQKKTTFLLRNTISYILFLFHPPPNNKATKKNEFLYKLNDETFRVILSL